MDNISSTLIEVNKLFVDSYFRAFILEIKYLNKKGYIKEKDYMLETVYPNVCCKQDELLKIQEFANKVKQVRKSFSMKDIHIALLMAYYNIAVTEYDEFINYKKIGNKADRFPHVWSLYMEIAGISCTELGLEHNCCYEMGKKIRYYDFEEDLNHEIRKYMVLGV